MPQVKPYRYFDTPDGEDTFKKLWCILKPSTKAAIGVGTVDVMLLSQPKGFIPTVARFSHLSWPILASSSAFVCATNISTNIRGKDDVINWFIGGFTAGSVFGMWSKRAIVGFNMGMLLGIVAVIRKHCEQNGWSLNPDVDSLKMNMGIRNYDWTLTANREGNWTNGK